MADVQTSHFCKTCQQHRRFAKPRINHTLHLILTICTLSLWGLVWIVLGILNASKPMRCTECGKTLVGSAMSSSSNAPTVAATQVAAAPLASDEIERLAALHAAGSLTDDEFAAAKQRALGL